MIGFVFVLGVGLLDALVIMYGFVVVSGTHSGFMSGPAFEFEYAFLGGTGIGYLFWAGFSKNAAFFVWLASMQLSRKWRTPVRLMDFLDDAYRRNVLRAVGPTYQFRHARLQDRLAAPIVGRDNSEPSPVVTSGAGES